MVKDIKQPDPIDIEVGGRIKAQRLARRMTQGHLAAMIGITFQQVQKYERGTNRVGASRLQSIAQTLAVPVAFFFEGPTEMEAVAATEDIMQFVGSSEGLALNRAFSRVKKMETRRRIAALVTAISQTSEITLAS